MSITDSSTGKARGYDAAPGNAEPQLGSPPRNEWYSRGYLPHRDRLGLLQSITFRLADSLPQRVMERLEAKFSLLSESERDVQKRKSLDAYLDAGHGCCALSHPALADIVLETFLKFDGTKYRLIAWCIMPNHIHSVIEPLIPLGKIVQSWKSYTGRWAMRNNAELGLSVPGTHLWMREYWDRFIRNEKHLAAVINYIHQNPVKAALCADAENWQYSSAYIQSPPGNAEPQLGSSPITISNSGQEND